MSDNLGTYLRDHLAGAAAAIEILQLLQDHYTGESLARFCAELRVDVESDRAVLLELAERAGGGSSVLKEATAWLGAKISRLKLGRAG